MTGWDDAIWAQSNLVWAALFDAEAELAALDADAGQLDLNDGKENQ